MHTGRGAAQNPGTLGRVLLAVLLVLDAAAPSAAGSSAGGWQAAALGKIDALDAELAERHADLTALRGQVASLERNERLGAQRMVTRASFDVGSGAVKVTVAEVDLHACINGHVTRVLHARKENLLLAEDLERGAEAARAGVVGGSGGAAPGAPRFSEGACAQLAEVLRAFKREAEAAGATDFAGAATAAFRRAANGAEVIARMDREVGVRLRVVSQEEEARLGWASANDQLPDEDEVEIIVWDSGGGSFQVTGCDAGEYFAWTRGVGSASAFAALVREVQGASLADKATPNPVSVEQAQALARLLKQAIGAPPPEVGCRLAIPGVKLYGIGGDTSIFSLAAQTADGRHVTKADVLRAIEGFCGKTDAQLRRCEDVPGAMAQPHLAIPKLVLLFAVLDLLEVPHVTYLPTNGLCGGILVAPEFWL